MGKESRLAKIAYVSKGNQCQMEQCPNEFLDVKGTSWTYPGRLGECSVKGDESSQDTRESWGWNRGIELTGFSRVEVGQMRNRVEKLQLWGQIVVKNEDYGAKAPHPRHPNSQRTGMLQRWTKRHRRMGKIHQKVPGKNK